MLLENVQKRINLLDKNVVKMSSEQLHIIETKKDRKADLIINLQNPSILFEKLEDKKLGYFINHCCADNVLLEYKDKKWILHIFELKRSVGITEWDKIKEQFKGALQNAFALSGLLDIQMQMEEIKVYTVYRNDKLNQQTNSVKQRMEMYEKKDLRTVIARNEWNAENVLLEVDKKYICKHTKIKLDVETGEGIYTLV